jgi:hypothetical protein
MAFRSVLALVLIPLALAGCVAESEPLPDAAVSSTTWLTITDDGVGPLTAGAPFQDATLATVAPGADIRTVEAAQESRTTWTRAAFINDIQAVQFFKDGNTVGEIHGVSQNLTGPNGERLGMTMRQARVARSDCRAGRDLWTGMAVCKARGAEHVSLVFSIPQYAGPFDVLPSADDLERATLMRIVWNARA